MSKRKATVCTILLSIVVIISLIGSMFVENRDIPISFSLYYLITLGFGIVKIEELIEKFYHWILGDSSK